MVDLWMAKAEAGLPWDAIEDIHSVLFDIMFSAVFGKDGDHGGSRKISTSVYGHTCHSSLNAKSHEILQVSKGHNRHLLYSAWIHPRLFNWLKCLLPSWRHSLRTINSMMKQRAVYFLQRDSLRESTAATTHFEAVLQQAGNWPGGLSPRLRRVAQDEAYSHMLGGQANIAHIAIWTVRCLTLYQDEQRNVREDLRVAYAEAWRDGRPPSLEEIISSRIQTPHLDAFLQEVLRCRPALSFVLRQTIHSTDILGYEIPPCTQVFIPTFGPGMTESPLCVPNEHASMSGRRVGSAARVVHGWEDPEEFRPVRWLHEDGDSGEVRFDPHTGPFLTFGAGRRGCFGKPLAYLSLRILLTLWIWNFDFEELPEDLRQDADFGLHPAMLPRTCYMKLSKA